MSTAVAAPSSEALTPFLLPSQKNVPQGIIIPPPELRNIIDTTATFIVRLGDNFEKQVASRERNNPKFGFLQPGDHYHSYYKWKIQEGRGGPSLPLQPIIEKVVEKKEEKKEGEEKVESKKPLLFAFKVAKAQPIEPTPPEFAVEVPEVYALELDVIKLTAQFVARNGRQFQVGLLNREIKNPQFEFLKSNHSLNGYFNSLVESYTKCLLSTRQTIENLKKDADKRDILARILGKVEWERNQRKQREQAEQEQDMERMARAMIDWHDFVVVETINFASDEEDETSTKPRIVAQEESAEVEMDTDEMDLDREPEQLKIRKDYYRPYTPAEQALKYQKCPQCGQNIPIEEMAEHIRIELLDPKAREMKLAQQERLREQPLASGDEIAQTLKNLSKRRTDIFGEKETEIGKTIGPDDENKPAKPDKVIWDGHTGSISRTTSAVISGMTIEDQIAAIHASKGINQPDEKPSIGPLKEGPGPAGLLPFPPNPLSSSGLLPSPTSKDGVPSQPKPPAPGVPLLRPPFPFPPSGMMPMPVPGMPFPPLPGMVPGMPLHPPPPVEDEPDSKRQKESHLIPEEDFIKQVGESINVRVQIPTGKPEWKWEGQTLTLSLSARDSINTVKDKIQEAIGMPSSKQKLRTDDLPVLKDNFTLAYYNISPTILLSLSSKERGGRKK
eukprot:TRINITY_DN4394_c0_g1_i1.p1 TRINITY_DN4394_c0_g1~~TRINITY_DN4394_c0_g1_i1.p1  ORF type:complete len:693 (-),score=176.67 TRINITY_DN4394_c0_g1_i1:97-2109(-)